MNGKLYHGFYGNPIALSACRSGYRVIVAGRVRVLTQALKLLVQPDDPPYHVLLAKLAGRDGGWGEGRVAGLQYYPVRKDEDPLYRSALVVEPYGVKLAADQAALAHVYTDHAAVHDARAHAVALYAPGHRAVLMVLPGDEKRRARRCPGEAGRRRGRVDFVDLYLHEAPGGVPYIPGRMVSELWCPGPAALVLSRKEPFESDAAGAGDL